MNEEKAKKSKNYLRPRPQINNETAQIVNSFMNFIDIVDMIRIIFVLGGLIVLIVWCMTMNKALDQVSKDIRKMEPGAVWLCLIPVFGFFWQFMVTNAVAYGVAEEFRVRFMFPKDSKPGMAMGLTGGILVCCSIIPLGGVGLGLVGLIFLIIQATKIREYNRALQESGRWEVRYQERMTALRQQQHIDSFGQPWQNVQQVYQAPAQPTHVSDVVKEKEKPKNPFE